MLDFPAHRDPTWHSRDFEAQVLVDLLRLSRLTVLYGAEGAGKTAFLKTDVLPLLRKRIPEDRAPQGGKPRVVVPFPDRRATDATTDRYVEIPVIFDRWDGEPLPALLARILDTLRGETIRIAAPLPSLPDSLAAWSEDLGVRFFIILDGFEQYLRAPFDRDGIAEFDAEFVRAINAPRLAAHFLLSVRDDAEALLNRFRGRIIGFGDAFLRLPNLHQAAAPLAATAATHQHTAGGSPPAEAWTPEAMEQVSDALFAAVSACTVPPPAPDTPPLAARTPLQDEASQPIALAPEARQAAPGITSPVVPLRSPRRPTMQWPLRASVAAMAAGFVIGAGAGYLALVQGVAAWQTAASPQSVATSQPAALSPVPAASAKPADEPVAPPPFAEPAARKSASPARPPTPSKDAKAAAPAPKVTARAAPVASATFAPAAVVDWQSVMRQELDVCGQESFFRRVVCVEQVRWKHCAPNRWNTAPECATGNTQVTLSD